MTDFLNLPGWEEWDAERTMRDYSQAALDGELTVITPMVFCDCPFCAEGESDHGASATVNLG